MQSSTWLPAVRVTTHLENLEKSGNSKVVREKSGKMEKVVREVKAGVFFSSSKYSKTRFSAGALPRTPLGELTTLPPDPLVGWGGRTAHPLPPAVTTPTVK